MNVLGQVKHNTKAKGSPPQLPPMTSAFRLFYCLLIPTGKCECILGEEKSFFIVTHLTHRNKEKAIFFLKNRRVWKIPMQSFSTPCCQRRIYSAVFLERFLQHFLFSKFRNHGVLGPCLEI